MLLFLHSYAVDGDKMNNIQSHHTWNRVYFNGSWWDVDTTNDATSNSKYGFNKLNSLNDILYNEDILAKMLSTDIGREHFCVLYWIAIYIIFNHYLPLFRPSRQRGFFPKPI